MVFMDLLKQGLRSNAGANLMGLGKKLLANMDTNLNAMAAVTMVSAVQGGSDRREVLVAQGSPATAEEARALVHREIYECSSGGVTRADREEYAARWPKNPCRREWNPDEKAGFASGADAFVRVLRLCAGRAGGLPHL